MRSGRPSSTAALVALMRAVASRDPALCAYCMDPHARALLPRRLAAMARAAQVTRAAARGMRVASLGLVDHLALRTHLIDRALLAALVEGARQVVLLGAGLDARAHRMHALHEATVFELDHPDTQIEKRRAARGLPVQAADLRYAPCDFERVSPAQALTRAGHDPTRPSAWIWEGVTMYLTPEAVAASLSEVSLLSPPGSTLILTHVTPDLNVGGDRWGVVGATALAALFAEPVRCPLTPSQLALLASERGFEVQQSELPADFARSEGIALGAWSRGMPAEYVAVLRKVE